MTPREAFELVESGELSEEEAARRLERSWWFPLDELFLTVLVVALFFIGAGLVNHFVGE